MGTNKYVVLLSTTNSMEEASKIAEHLVSNHLVACVNMVPSVHSVYWWDNKVNHDHEVLLILKTKKSKVADVEKAIRSLHSYETPELIGWPLEYGMREYLSWIEDTTK